jgi:hypothetical protein
MDAGVETYKNAYITLESFIEKEKGAFCPAGIAQ